MASTTIIRLLRADEPPVETVGTAGKYLTFRVARQDFAMDASLLHGILPFHELVRLDTGHLCISGFARDFPVIDLRAKLGIPHGSHGREPFIIVVETPGGLAGFIAGRVSDVVDCRPRDFRNGMLRAQGRPRRVLQADEIMAARDWAELRAAASSR